MKIPRFLPRFRGIHVIAPVLCRIISITGRVNAIALFPFVFYRNEYIKMNIIKRNHEIIHLQQQMECGLAGTVLYIIFGFLFSNWLVVLPALFLFYILYILNFLILWIFTYRTTYQAYIGVSFEREAYFKANLVNYYVLRRPFNWFRYIYMK